MAIESDVLVIGGGLAGTAAALAAAREGADVRLVSHKTSTLRQASGLIDALGYVPATSPSTDLRTGPPSAERELDRDEWPDPDGPLVDPFDAIDRLPPDHPYRLVGVEALRDGLALFDDVAGDRYRGSHTDRNALVVTFGGTVKPTARYPASAAGTASDPRPMLVVGLRKLTAYDGRLVADRLAAAGYPFAVAGAEVSLADTFADDVSITRIARALQGNERLDGAPARRRLARAVAPRLDDVAGGAERVGLPAVFGEDDPAEVRRDLEERLGVDVFEIAMGPPSLPGLRLENTLTAALEDADVRFETGVPVVDYDSAGSRIERVLVDRTGREVPYDADQFVLATGGLVGKGIDSGREGVSEPVLDCHVPHPDDRYEWFVDDAFGDQPFARFGVDADEWLRPLDADGTVQYRNVRVAGATLGGADVARENSASGVSLATGLAAGRLAAGRR